MGLNEVGGLPAHILLVHAVIVLVPLAAGLTVVSAVWPAARRKLGILTPLLALVALVTVPITVQAGEWLQERVFIGDANRALIERHTELGDGLLPWVLGLFVLAAGQWGYYHFGARRRSEKVDRQKVNRPIVVGFAVLAIAASAGSIVQVYRIGESGSKAVWTGNFSANPR